jgi:hypothetical protein
MYMGGWGLGDYELLIVFPVSIHQLCPSIG